MESRKPATRFHGHWGSGTDATDLAENVHDGPRIVRLAAGQMLYYRFSNSAESHDREDHWPQVAFHRHSQYQPTRNHASSSGAARRYFNKQLAERCRLFLGSGNFPDWQDPALRASCQPSTSPWVLAVEVVPRIIDVVSCIGFPGLLSQGRTLSNQGSLNDTISAQIRIDETAPTSTLCDDRRRKKTEVWDCQVRWPA